MRNFNPVLGAIVGDIVGSVYEFNNHKSKDFEFINEHSIFTDDTIHTLAVYTSLIESRYDANRFKSILIKNLKNMSLRYIDSPSGSYGLMFIDWIYSEDSKPYNSLGNGSAMRVSSIPYVIREYTTMLKFASISASITHNHVEGIRGAECIARLIYTMKLAPLPSPEVMSIVKDIATSYYTEVRDTTYDDLYINYEYNETCAGTVPQAIICFLESTDFEDAIRNAISIGGDSDTLAAITGSLAATYYGVPRDIEELALSKLDPYLSKIYYNCINFEEGI